MKKRIHIRLWVAVSLLAFAVPCVLRAQVTLSENSRAKDRFTLAGKSASALICYDEQDAEVVKQAARFLAHDIGLVTGRPADVSALPAPVPSRELVVVGTIGQNTLIDKLIATGKLNVEAIRGGWEQYAIERIERPVPGVSSLLVIAGSDRRGTAYGVFHVSEAIGVSPWYWWADMPVRRREEIVLSVQSFRSKEPSVKFRGLFINDEDWGLKPWASKTFEPETGDIGPKTYAKICELLLRLKGNYLCPAMHSCTRAFNHYPDNKKVADSLAIVMGSVHCEPLLFNNASEWDRKTMGDWNYVTNKEGINRVLRQRVEENGIYENVYTLAMRGIHDAVMAGNLSLDDQARVLEGVFDDQRQILSEVIGRPASEIPQAFTPYKEVLHTYEHGMNIPDDVTIVWGDDDFGYMKRLSNAAEQQRGGRSGVYYHLSYWGPPKHYLWINTTPPALMYNELRKAYDTTADGIWLANVGDIKPAEYALTLFLDMAYDIDAFDDENVLTHQAEMLARYFGAEYYDDLTRIFDEYYSLAFARKPEYMERGTDTEFSVQHYREAERRLARYRHIDSLSQRIFERLDEAQKPAYFQFVHYNVRGSALMNAMTLEAQRNRWYASQGRASANEVREQVKEYAGNLQQLNRHYNEMLGGKWNYMMSLNHGGARYFEEGRTDSVTLSGNPELGVYAENGHPQTGIGNIQALPCFNPFTRRSYYIDVFNKGAGLLAWSAEASEPWVKLSRRGGSTATEERIDVSIDWNNAPEGTDLSAVVNIRAGEKTIPVFVSLFNPTGIDPETLNGLYVEDNGVVSIDAAGFHRKFEREGIAFDVIRGLGFEDKVVRLGDPFAPTPYYDALELTSNYVAPVRGDRFPLLEYDFWSFSSGPVDVYTYMMPLFPLDSDHGSRYGVMVDNSPVYLPEAGAPYYSTLWIQSILRNCRVNKTTHTLDKPGKHTVKIFAAHPGMMIQKIVIDFGGMKHSYTGPTPTLTACPSKE